MSKQLTPLEAFNNIRQTLISEGYSYNDDLEDLLIIETALKENSELRTSNYELLKESEHFYNERNEYKRALEIIKESTGIKISIDKDVGCLYIHINNLKTIVLGYVYGKEKVDLLKEVLL